MDAKEKMKAVGVLLVWFFLGLLCCSLFGSCKSQFVDISDDMFIHDTIRIEKVSIDTLIQHDSIWHYECLKGDTVLVKDYVYKYIYKPKVEYRDSIVYRDREQVYTVTKEVEKKLTKWQKIKIDMGELLITALVLLLVAMGVRIYLRFKKGLL